MTHVKAIYKIESDSATYYVIAENIVEASKKIDWETINSVSFIGELTE